MYWFLLPLAMVAITASAQFQENRTQELRCDGNSSNGRNSRTCSVEERTIGGTGRLEISPTHNGSIAVKGWSQNTVLVRARIEAWGKDDAAAADVARQVRLEVTAGRVRAEGPEFRNLFGDNDRGWSVSFEIFAPHNTDLNASTHNGAVTVADIKGRIAFETHNGAVKLIRVAGDVAGNTHNGGVNVELAGTSFDGQRLEVETHNGGVTLAMPSNFSAHVDASTHNGRVDTDFPVTVSGRLDQKKMSFNIGSGGSPIRVSTHNGGIRVRQI